MRTSEAKRSVISTTQADRDPYIYAERDQQRRGQQIGNNRFEYRHYRGAPLLGRILPGSSHYSRRRVNSCERPLVHAPCDCRCKTSWPRRLRRTPQECDGAARVLRTCLSGWRNLVETFGRADTTSRMSQHMQGPIAPENHGKRTGHRSVGPPLGTIGAVPSAVWQHH